MRSIRFSRTLMALTVSSSIFKSSGAARPTLRAARRDILITAFFACCKATAGLLYRRSSSTGMLSSCASSTLLGTVSITKRLSTPLQGRNSSMAHTLDKVWMFAMELLFITSPHMGMPMVNCTA